MAYSQQTTHYGLPLPTSGDKSTFLDTNDAFGRIDSDIYEAKTNASAAVQDIGQIQLDVSELKASTLEMRTDISQLTSRQTISETNITALQSAMTTAQADVTKLQNDYGTTDISSIGDGTVTGAISALSSGDAESVQVVSDGVKTLGQLASELLALIDSSKINAKSVLVKEGSGSSQIFNISTLGSMYFCTNTEVDSSGIQTDYINLSATPAAGRWNTSTSGSTHISSTSNVQPAGITFKVIY